jgi:hypothetical protein
MLCVEMRPALVLCAVFASCSESELSPRGLEGGDGVVAEVHLHQYALGSHSAAGFLRASIPYRRELDEQLVHFLTEPTARDGDCRLDVQTQCSPVCDGATQYCDRSQCRPYTPLQFLDGGPVTITGSSVVSPITLTFDARIPGYRSGRLASAPLFSVGDRLIIDVPSGLWAFHAEVVAPPTPELLTSFALPASGPLRVTWRAVSSSIAIRISVAAQNGADGSITCVYDEDRGEALIPEAFVSALPPKPRAVIFSIERFERRMPAVAPGKFAVVTVASTHVVETRE